MGYKMANLLDEIWDLAQDYELSLPRADKFDRKVQNILRSREGLAWKAESITNLFEGQCEDLFGFEGELHNLLDMSIDSPHVYGDSGSIEPTASLIQAIKVLATSSGISSSAPREDLEAILRDPKSDERDKASSIAALFGVNVFGREPAEERFNYELKKMLVKASP